MTGYPRFEVLSFDIPEERERWRELYHRFAPGAIDVFYLPEYAHLFALHGDGRACCFVYHESPERLVLYPFHLRPIRDLPLFRHLDRDWVDLASPYGYGGYLASHADIDLGRFFKVFREYCRERQVVSELTRFHPLLGNHEYCRPFVPTQRLSEVVVLDLRAGPEQLWNGFSPTGRNKIRKAGKRGVTIRIDATWEHLDTFHTLYTATMARVTARDYYYFSRQWFDQVAELLAGRAVLFHAQAADRIVASSLFLYAGDFMHYFLSGSDAAHAGLGANNLLLHEAALWAQSRGIKYLNLGGGIEANDSLFAFKASFSPLRATFCVGQIIHEQTVYQFLCDHKLAAEGHKSLETQFFPLYRAPRLEPVSFSDTQSAIIILGASGHARVCLDILQAQRWPVLGFFDDNPELEGTSIHDLPVLGNISAATEMIQKRYIKTIIAIGDNYERKRIFSLLAEYNKDSLINEYLINVIHPSAILSPKSTMEYGNFIAPGVIINTDTQLGSGIIINTGATIDHDNTIHDFAQISPGCNLAGNVTVEEGAFLGTGAVVLPGKTIGAYAIVGAGAVVIDDIPPYCTAVGVPARVIKRHHGVARLSDGRSKS
jgi:sugar O-acyltransferase (sialic acid O-acetyltransferase NeuD family)